MVSSGDDVPGGRSWAHPSDAVGDEELQDVFVLKEDLLRGLGNPKLRGKTATLERLILEIGSQLIQYCYAEIFSLDDLVRATVQRAQQNGFPNALPRVLELWELSLEDDPRLESIRAEMAPAPAKPRRGRPRKLAGDNGQDESSPHQEADATIWQIDKNGKIRPNEANALKAMELLGIKLSYDEFARESVLEGLSGYGPQIEKDAISKIYLRIQSEFFFRIAFEDLERIIRVAAKDNSFDPIVDYLDGLQWDGVERLDEWLVTYGGAEDSPYVREVGAKFLIAAVRRARHPGCKFDYMPIFEGEEGRGKSSVGAILAGAEYFTDSIPIHSHDPRHTIEALRGKWICEAGELASIKRAQDVETVKAWLSRSTDTAALKWERDSTGVKRRFVVLGTTNPDGTGYFDQRTGNRRFWPVRVAGFDLAAVARDRNNLWAEASYRERAGEGLEISDSVKPMAKAAQQEREVSDAWEEMLEAWAATVDGAEFVKSFAPRIVQGTMARIAETALRVEPNRLSRADQHRIAIALVRLGFKKEHTRIGKVWRRVIYGL